MGGNAFVRHERLSVIRFCAVLSLLAFTAARPIAAKVTVDFDPGADFAKFKSFAFAGGVPNLVMLQMDPDLIYTQIHRAVARELENKGLREVAPGQDPDLVVRYWVCPGSQVNVAVMGNWGPYDSYLSGHWGQTYNAAAVSNAKVTTLVVDLIDAKAKSLTWRLYVTQKLSDLEKDWKKADEEFTEGFKSYPPAKGAKDEKGK